MSEWQDISTAPKDGSWIFAFSTITPGKPYQVLRWQGGGWTTWNSFGDYKDPTHWRPPPDPPSTVKGESDS